MLHGNDLESDIGRKLDSLEGCQGMIAGAVVDADDFKGAIILLEHRFDGPAHAVGMVVYRYDDTQLHGILLIGSMLGVLLSDALVFQSFD